MRINNLDKYFDLVDNEKNITINRNPEGIILDGAQAEKVQKYVLCTDFGLDAELTKQITNSKINYSAASIMVDLSADGIDISPLLGQDYNDKQIVELANVMRRNDARQQLNYKPLDTSKLFDQKLTSEQIKFGGLAIAQGLDPSEILNNATQTATLGREMLLIAHDVKDFIDTDKEIEEHLKNFINKEEVSINSDENQLRQLKESMGATTEIKVAVLADGNVMLNNAAKGVVSDFLGMETARKQAVSDWENNISNREARAELSAKAAVLASDMQKVAIMYKDKFTESVPLPNSYPRSAIDDKSNLKEIYNNLTHKNTNIITMRDYVQVIKQFERYSQSFHIMQKQSQNNSFRR